MKKAVFTVLAGLFLLMACRKDPVIRPSSSGDDTLLPTRLTPRTLQAPLFFPPVPYPAANPPYEERIALGRRLFYDPVVSGSNVSCGSCHKQQLGFWSDTVLTGQRAVMPLVNLAWTTNWSWYGSASGSMESVLPFAIHPFLQPDLVQLNADTGYQKKFADAFGVQTITRKEISYALSQFVRTLISGNSRYYQSLTGQIQFNNYEEQGRVIFFSERGDCFHCHSNPQLIDNAFHNTGLDSVFVTTANNGRYNVTGNPADLGKFRTANLYNVGLRSRFMHDGRYRSLEEVVAFYNSGGHRTATIDSIMTKPGKENGLRLSDLEQYQLVQFLKTFTDSAFVNNPEFSRP